MAEVVFQNLEDRLPELEELEREGVFTREELRVIIKRRTDFEYKLQKRIMEKNDILNYLEYEIKLDLLRKKRSKKLKLKPYNSAALGMSRKIHTIFRKGLMKFSDDLSLWMQYIDFCKKTGSQRAIGLAYGKLLQQHANNPNVWLMAAKHEAEEMNNIENARMLFQKALRINKDSVQLWHEYFRLELMHVDKIKKRKQVLLDGGIQIDNEEEPDEPKEMEDFLLNKTAEIVFNSSLKVINSDIDFRLKFVSICQEFEETDQLEELIYKTIETDFHDNESLYEALCIHPMMKLQRKSFIIKDSDWISAESEVDGKFQDAIEKKKTCIMYEKYLNCFAKLLHESNSPEQMKRRLSIVLKILENSEKDECITDLMYLFWSEMLIRIGKEDAVMDCLTRAVVTHSKSLPVWQNYLYMKMKNASSWDSVSSEFTKCLSLLKEDDQLVIWRFYIVAAKVVSEEETELVFAGILKARKVVKDLFLPQYLDWIYKTKGIHDTRKFYREQLKGFVDLKFLEACIDIENAQDRKKIKKLRFLHEKATTDYGEKSSDVWLSYIRFEKESDSEDFDRAGKIYLRAKKTLSGKQNAEFITQYSLM